MEGIDTNLFLRFDRMQMKFHDKFSSHVIMDESSVDATSTGQLFERNESRESIPDIRFTNIIKRRVKVGKSTKFLGAREKWTLPQRELSTVSMDVKYANDVPSANSD